MAVHVPPRIFRRVPFETAVRLQFDRFKGFVEEYSANLSLGGMFIRTDEPLEVGAEMPIEFRLGEDYELIHGRGRVVWVRDDYLDDDHPRGMGIRFLELTPGSRELIFKLVERRVREGGEPFDLEAEAEMLEDLPMRPPEPGPAPEALVGLAAPDLEPLPGGSVDAGLEPGGRRGFGDAGGEGSSEAQVFAEEDFGEEEDAASGAASGAAAGFAGAGFAGLAGALSSVDGEPEEESDFSGLGFALAEGEAEAPAGSPNSGRGKPGDDEDSSGPGAGDGPPAFASSSSRARYAADSSDEASFRDLDDEVASWRAPSGERESDEGESGAAAGVVDGGVSAFGNPLGDEPGPAPPGGDASGSHESAGERSTPAAVAADDSFTGSVDARAAAPAGPALFADGPAGEPSGRARAPGNGAAFDNEEEESFLRRRKVLLFGLPLLVVAVLGLAWWFLGPPPELEERPEPQVATGAPAGVEAGGAATGGGRGVGAADVEGGLDSIRATPPGMERGEDDPRGEVPPGSEGAGTTAGEGAGAGTEGAAERFEGEVPVAEPTPTADGGTTSETGAPAQAVAPADAASGAADPGAAPSAPLQVQRVDHRTEGGRTIVEVTVSRPLRGADFRYFSIGGISPRHVVRFLGVDSPLPAGQVTLDTPQVARVRTGLHLGQEPPELHLVFDLNSPEVRVESVEPAGERLRIVFAGGGG